MTVLAIQEYTEFEEASYEREAVKQDISPTFWSFPMERRYLNSSKDYNGTYWFCLLDDPDGRQWIGFSGNRENIEYAILYDNRASPDLAIPFALFSRFVERILEAQIGTVLRINEEDGDRYSSFGEFTAEERNIQFLTNCGMEFHIDRAVLADLAS